MALMLIQFNSLSQTYIIPWATKQPAWVFPIWVEDATGAKDTVYIGYDNKVSTYPCTIDSGYGEEFFFIPPNNTNMYLTNCEIPMDSVQKANVVSNIPGLPFGTVLNLHWTTFPVIIRWDRSLLNSDSLPYPSQAPAPRAQLLIYAWVNNNIIPACGSTSILATDSCVSACCQPDSVIIDNSISGVPISSSITCLIMGWTGSNMDGIQEEDENSLISVLPNPSKGVINITSKKLINKVGYFDVYGNYKKIVENIKEVVVTNLRKGIYIFQFEIDAKMYFKKVVVFE